MKNGFAAGFEKLTGNRPYPWQTALSDRLCSGQVPRVCVAPRLGKTSVIPIWFLACIDNPALPRRLVYVVNRRTVVDQTTTEVEKLREKLPEIGRKSDDLAISSIEGVQERCGAERVAPPLRVMALTATARRLADPLEILEISDADRDAAAQHCGSVTRFAERAGTDGATVPVVHHTDFDVKKAMEDRRAKTLELLKRPEPLGMGVQPRGGTEGVS